MQYLKKPALRAMSVLALASMAACGGGSGGDQPKTTTRTGQSAAAPANTLVVSSGTSAIAKGNHPLDTGYVNASGLLSIPGSPGFVVEWVFPESPEFDAALFFAQGDHRKFGIGLFENVSSDKSYQCVSTAWTAQELAALATAFGDSSIPTSPKCPSDITLDGPGHHMGFTDWTLTSTDGTKWATFSLNVSWLLQNGVLSPSGSGSGSGSVISVGGTNGGGAIGAETVISSGSGGSISLPSGSIHMVVAPTGSEAVQGEIQVDSRPTQPE